MPTIVETRTPGRRTKTTTGGYVWLHACDLGAQHFWIRRLLKILRRPMYDGAGVELLRARVLPMPAATPRHAADVGPEWSDFYRTTSAIIDVIDLRQREVLTFAAPSHSQATRTEDAAEPIQLHRSTI